jgi:hypothetical protein
MLGVCDGDKVSSSGESSIGRLLGILPDNVGDEDGTSRVGVDSLCDGTGIELIGPSSEGDGITFSSKDGVDIGSSIVAALREDGIVCTNQ